MGEKLQLAAVPATLVPSLTMRLLLDSAEQFTQHNATARPLAVTGILSGLWASCWGPAGS